VHRLPESCVNELNSYFLLPGLDTYLPIVIHTYIYEVSKLHNVHIVQSLFMCMHLIFAHCKYTFPRNKSTNKRASRPRRYNYLDKPQIKLSNKGNGYNHFLQCNLNPTPSPSIYKRVMNWPVSGLEGSSRLTDALIPLLIEPHVEAYCRHFSLYSVRFFRGQDAHQTKGGGGLQNQKSVRW
jgi:hypothetical protein